MREGRRPRADRRADRRPKAAGVCNLAAGIPFKPRSLRGATGTGAPPERGGGPRPREVSQPTQKDVKVCCSFAHLVKSNEAPTGADGRDEPRPRGGAGSAHNGHDTQPRPERAKREKGGGFDPGAPLRPRRGGGAGGRLGHPVTDAFPRGGGSEPSRAKSRRRHSPRVASPEISAEGSAAPGAEAPAKAGAGWTAPRSEGRRPGPAGRGRRASGRRCGGGAKPREAREAGRGARSGPRGGPACGGAKPPFFQRAGPSRRGLPLYLI